MRTATSHARTRENGIILSFAWAWCMLFAMLVTPATLTAQTERTIEANVCFRQGEWMFDTRYKDNARQLADFIEQYRLLSCSDSVVLSAITVTGLASPDGSYSANQRLSVKRTENIANYLRQTLGLADSLVLQRADGIDWDGLAAAIEGMEQLAERNTMLDIIRTTPELTGTGRNKFELRKQRLISLGGGNSWRYLKRHVFPTLRSTNVHTCVTYTILSDNTAQDTVPEIATDTVVADTTYSQTEIVATDTTATDTLPTDSVAKTSRHRVPVFAARTNLLLPLLNVGFEVPIGNNWSVGFDYYYPWQPRHSNHKNSFQTTMLTGEARYWFGKNRSDERRLLGHSVAVYGAWGYYDIERNWSGHQGDLWSVGADYLYAIPIAKGRLHLEFQLAVGYMHTKATPYDVFTNGGFLIRRRNVYKNFNYFGPTKVGVSLVLPLTKKGGTR